MGEDDEDLGQYERPEEIEFPEGFDEEEFQEWSKRNPYIY
jgi:hypothetical protein